MDVLFKDLILLNLLLKMLKLNLHNSSCYSYKYNYFERVNDFLRIQCNELH